MTYIAGGEGDEEVGQGDAAGARAIDGLELFPELLQLRADRQTS